MAATTIITRPTPAQIDTIVIDAAVTETHTLSNTVTDHPVEEGSNVSDHSRPEPDKIQLDCVVSDTPLQTTSSGSTVSVESHGFRFSATAKQDTTRSKNAYDKLVQLREQGSLVTVVTSLRSYDSMAIESIQIPRDAKNAGALRFTVSLKKVRVVKNKLTRTTVASDKRVGAKVKTGNQTTKAATEQDIDPARQVVDGIKGAAQKIGSL